MSQGWTLDDFYRDQITSEECWCLPVVEDVEGGSIVIHNRALFAKRQSIEPTYDHRETGDRFTVETVINGRPLGITPTRDPFVNHRVVVGWRDLVVSLLRRRLEVVVIVGGDPEIVDDVMELDADCLTMNSTRRDEWNEQVQSSLSRQRDLPESF